MTVFSWKKWLCFLCIFFAALSTCQAETTDEKTFAENLAQSGITFDVVGNKMTIVIDELKALNTIPKLQQLGYLNKNIKLDDVKKNPTILAFMIGMLFTAVIVHHEYAVNSGMDKLQVQSFMLTPVAKAKFVKQPCYSFEFDRRIYNKVNWEKISEGGFAKSSRNYKMSPWCYQHLLYEKQNAAGGASNPKGAKIKKK